MTANCTLQRPGLADDKLAKNRVMGVTDSVRPSDLCSSRFQANWRWTFLLSHFFFNVKSIIVSSSCCGRVVPDRQTDRRTICVLFISSWKPRCEETRGFCIGNAGFAPFLYNSHAHFTSTKLTTYLLNFIKDICNCFSSARYIALDYFVSRIPTSSRYLHSGFDYARTIATPRAGS